jgi:hypothetical protein
MPDKRNYYQLVTYLEPLGSMTPLELREQKMPSPNIPDGSILATEIVEDLDFVTQDDWERVGYMQMLTMERQIRRNGWPKGAGDGEPSRAPAQVSAGDVSHETSSPEAREKSSVETAEGVCWNCNSNLVTTGKRTLCPQGCDQDMKPPDPVEVDGELGADGPRSIPISTGAGGPEKPYEPTRESRPPESFPQGKVETTD